MGITRKSWEIRNGYIHSRVLMSMNYGRWIGMTIIEIILFGICLSLDPNNPDTNGDGVEDGVEILDNQKMWPDDESGLYNQDNSATNPLDPNDFDPNEVGRSIDYYQ